MKNYGDSLNNCNDNEEKARNLRSNDETPISHTATSSQVNYIIISWNKNNKVLKYVFHNILKQISELHMIYY